MPFNIKDHYFKKAKKEKYLARSVYKLEEIDKRFSILTPGDSVLDLGYYPGSWIQYSSSKVGKKGKVVGVDIKHINKKLLHEKNITLFEKDIFDLKSLDDLNEEEMFDVVLSDMAPNTTGISSVDQDRSLNIVEEVFSLLPLFLKRKGNFVIKVFEGHAAREFLKKRKSLFENSHFLRPKSTRTTSKEFFFIAKNFMP